MRWIFQFLASSIGRKFTMALSGLFLLLFLLVHLAGNLMLLANDQGRAFLGFAEFMAQNRIIRLLELGLFFGFGLHILGGISLALHNRKARPEGYVMNRARENSSWASRHMPLSGALVLVFLVWHMQTFFIEQRLLESPHNMYEVVLAAFRNPWYVLLYVGSFLVLALHLKHAFASAFQTLGLRHRQYSPLISFLGFLYALLVPLLFASIPVCIYLQQFI